MHRYCFHSRPSFVLGERHALFKRMDKETEQNRAYYSSSLSPWQVNFVHGKIGDVQNAKNLVRLVKEWSKTHCPVCHIL